MIWEFIGAIGAALGIGVAIGGLRGKGERLSDSTGHWGRVTKAGRSVR